MSNTAPLREQILNLGATTLSAGINNSTTSVSVTSGAVFPSTGNFRVRVGSEIMLVTARSTNTLTVVRGYEGTTAASHSSGDAITLVLTSGGLNRYAQDNNPLFGLNRPPFGLYDTDGKTLLTTSNFTWANQGSTTASDQNGTIIMDLPAASGENGRLLYRAAPSPTYSVIAAFQHVGLIETSAYNQFGIVLRQSTTGKYYAHAFSSDNGTNPLKHVINKFAGPTSSSSGTLLNFSFTQRLSPYVWLKVSDDNTNLKFFVSGDGMDWIQTGSEARGTFLTTSGGVTGPDQVGFYANNNSSSLFHSLCRLVHWSYL